MERIIVSDFKGFQIELLLDIKKKNGQIDKELLHSCNRFLVNQRQQLTFLETKRRVHLMERGKVNFRLVANEEVPLSFLKEIFTVFARPLDDFIQHVTRILKMTNQELSPKLVEYKQEALNIASDMMKICPVLKQQPENTNYEKKENKVPELIFLGAQCLSNVEISNCDVVAVSESDLHKASKDSLPPETVCNLKGFVVSQETTKQAKGSKPKPSTQKTDCITEFLGIWAIPKEKLTTSDKGHAHKDWIRLKFTAQIKYEGITENLWLLSLPFNIRKGSCQMYTFVGALMWYFYNTADPYKEFSVIPRLPISTVLDMIFTRLEVIGRPLSQQSKDFFKERLTNLSSNGKVELEILARGPPSTKKEEIARRTDGSPTVDQAIDIYGFFTWFYALAQSLDSQGHLNRLWLEGYIYDICEHDHMKNLVIRPEFGYQTVIFRPSLSVIYNYQGKEINMGLAYYFKKFDQPGHVFHLNITEKDIKDSGLYQCITLMMPLEILYMKDGGFRSLEVLKTYEDDPLKDYHGTGFSIVTCAQLSCSDAMKKHCFSCQCYKAELNSSPDDSESLTKKARNPSGNSDDISSTSDWQVNSLTHKRKISQNGGSQTMDEQEERTSPFNITSTNQWNSHEPSTATGSPDSGNDFYMSPAENRIPDFDLILSSGGGPCTYQPVSPSVFNREQLVTNFHKACTMLSSVCHDELLERLKNDMLKLADYLQTNPRTPSEQNQYHDENKGNLFLTDLNSGQVMQNNSLTNHFKNDTGHINMSNGGISLLADSQQDSPSMMSAAYAEQSNNLPIDLQPIIDQIEFPDESIVEFLKFNMTI